MQNCSVPVLAIDGHARAGKGTARERVAEALGWNELDSGLLYRLVAYLGQEGDTEDHYKVVAGGISDVRISKGIVYLYGRELSHELRTPEIDALVPRVAAISEVRSSLRIVQERMRVSPGLVADGRDMAFLFTSPNVHRFFITASLTERARRQVLEMKKKDQIIGIERVIESLRQRDLMDQTRTANPLQIHPEAEVIDTTDMSESEVAEHIITAYRSKTV